MALKRALRSAAAAGDVAGLRALLRVAGAAAATTHPAAATTSPPAAALAATRAGGAVLDLTRHPDTGVAVMAAVLMRRWRVGVGARE
jgi:hypothetical protein